MTDEISATAELTMSDNYTLERETQCQNSIDLLRDLLGDGVVLLPCAGKKPVVKGWQNLTIEAMDDASYIKRLRTAGTIGVLLGEHSGGLCVVDFDVDGEDEKFLQLNPLFADTLRTRGRRGSSFWLRMVGDYPASTSLKLNGTGLGEWRADGNQSIVVGEHPAGGQYQMLNEARPVEIPFDQIRWPEGISLVTQTTHTIPHQTLEHSNTRIHQSSTLCDTPAQSEDELVRQCLPAKAGQNHDELFRLARVVRTLERDTGGEYGRADLLRVFGKWFKQSMPHLRQGQTRDEYLEEFLQACDCAERPLDENALALAFERAKTTQLPDSAAKVHSEAGKMLVAICFQLQELAGDREFYLSCYKAAPLLGVKATSAARLLRQLVRKKVLRVVEKWRDGRARRATRYRFADKPKSIEV